MPDVKKEVVQSLWWQSDDVSATILSSLRKNLGEDFLIEVRGRLEEGLKSFVGEPTQAIITDTVR